MSAGVAASKTRRWSALLARWETLLLVALIGLIVLGNALSPFFLTAGNFSNLIAALMEVAIMALPMTLIIVAGEIDLSVESMAGLACASSASCTPPACRSAWRSRWSSWSAPSAACSTACSSRAADCRRSS